MYWNCQSVFKVLAYNSTSVYDSAVKRFLQTVTFTSSESDKTLPMGNDLLPL